MFTASAVTAYIHRCFHTAIDFVYEADSHFPDLDEDEEWEITAESDDQTYFDLEYQFVKYERKK